jgi:hypothetical protein
MAVRYFACCRVIATGLQCGVSRRPSGLRSAHPGDLDCDGHWRRPLGRLHFICLRSDSSRLPVWNLAVRAVQTRGCTTQMNTGTLQLQLSMSEMA